jgi:hypothetical protein
MVVTLTGAIPFTGMTGCYATGGFDNTRGKTVTCEFVVATSEFRIRNFNKLITNHVNQYTIRIDAGFPVGTVGIVTAVATTAAIQIYASL